MSSPALSFVSFGSLLTFWPFTNRIIIIIIIKRGFQLYASNAATQGPKHASQDNYIERSNLTQAMSRDKFQPCHWPLLEFVAFLA